jgi:gluconokinase
LFCFAIDENLYIIGGPVNNGGIVLQWFNEQVLGGDVAQYPALLAAAEQVPIGAEGLLCLPYLQGERAPLWDSLAKGAFIGLSIHHHRAHLVRALLEAIVFSLRHTAEVLEATMGKPRVLLMSGGLGQADFWVQMVADCFQTPVQMTATLENSALGAALLALKGLGLLPDYQLISEWFPPVRTFQPNPEHQAAYDHQFTLYKQAYWAMRQTVQGLSNHQPIE